MTSRYFGEPFKTRQIAQRGYIDPVGPDMRDGSVNYRVREEQRERTIGHLRYSMPNLFPEADSEGQLIQLYREISEHPDVDFAIEEIVNEFAAIDGESEPVSIDLDAIEEISDEMKEIITNEFSEVLSLMRFNSDAFELFRRYYIDSRLAFYKAVDPDHPEEGIQELRIMDPISLRKVREVVTKERNSEHTGRFEDVIDEQEYFLYTPQISAYDLNGSDLSGSMSGFGPLDMGNLGALGLNQTQTMLLNTYAVAYIDSGMFDSRRNCVKGFLHKVIKPLNDLTNLETHMIIYRIARAPERRVFYIDTGNLPPSKAQSYLNMVQDSYRTQVSYDSQTGRIQSDSKTISMHEDYWLPRSADGKGTDVQTLNGAQNLNQIEDIEYLNKKFHNALNVPPSRFDAESGASQFFFGASRENSREEVKFQKFVSRLRAKFNELFRDILRTQLILKGLMTADQWWEIENRVTFYYERDRFIEESRKFAVFQQKVEIIRDASDLVGTYVSKEWVRREILGMTDEEIELEAKRMAKEKEEGGDDEGGFF